MDSIFAFWNGQDKRRLVVLALATLAAFSAVLFLSRIATAPRMELLYANLDPAVAAEVVASLEGHGALYEVRGGSIYVDGAVRDSLRLQLAGDGLPRDNGGGYELLDGLSGFGTTSQMFDAAYWRAREGELTRTILAGTGVKLARVHLATADASPFSRDQSATASVTLQMVTGAVDISFARAIQSLVAGAVRDLAPEDVTIIDSSSGRVVGGAEMDSERERRDDRIAEMRSAVENILAARVGEGRYVVELSLETTTARETITERVLDPESRVVISTDTEERTANDRGATNGVTVASNLPDGEAGGGEQESQSAETRERVNYDFSATQRQVEKSPGAIERVTVAVLVDGLRDEETGSDAAWTPRPDEELDILRDLVSSAVGYRESRGDVVTVRSMQFEELPDIEAAPGLSLPWFTGAQISQMVSAGLLALVAVVAIVLGLRSLRPSPNAQEALPSAPPLDTDTFAGLPAPADNAFPQIGTPDGAGDASDPGADVPDFPELPDFSDLSALPMASMDGSASESEEEDDPVERLRQLISDRRDETIEVLRGWVDDVAEDTT